MGPVETPVRVTVPVPTAPERPSAAPAPTVGQRFISNDFFTEVTRGASTDAEVHSGYEPIAIIGMSGRFAESESLNEFWQNIEAGKDLIRKVSRWSAADCVTSDADGPGYCSHGSFIDSVDLFDPAFFRITADEALYMEPQQRLFLEESWKALEDAGYAGKSSQETQCGVYVGCAGSSNYASFFGAEPPAHAFWGNSDSIIPARIAYCLNLQGPAIAVDTACSSSLVSLHLACQGLWSRETDMALAGGVCLHATPIFYHVANRAHMLSPDGTCYSFDARANGFVPGEGVGVLVLKRLRDAVRDGDTIHGVIAGSGINQDGASNGLIAPNPKAQERLERSVYDRFKIDPETIQLVEAHGTGTLLGDSIEYGAISRSFLEYTDKKQFCAIGTVKTNIGHTGGAAGVAGVLKLLLALKHRQIPPSLHFEKGNPAINFESSPFYVNTELKEWRVEGDRKRRAAVSSFGFSGTNAHVVIEDAPQMERSTVDAPGYVVVLSARTPEQLKQQAEKLLAHLQRTPGVSLNDLSFTLFVGRMHLNHRLSCVARNEAELIQRLEQWVLTGTAAHVYTSEAQEGKLREHAALKRFGNYCIQECRNATTAASYLENLAAIADLYVQGHALDFLALFSADSRRIPLPTYPFARERYWIDAAGAAVSPGSAANLSTRLHPLLHSNTSILGQQSYTSTLTGAEFYLRDHQKVMPGMAYLEMARAAMERAAPHSSASFAMEVEETVWGEPLVVAGPTQMTIALSTAEDDRVDFEVYSGETVHCQGRISFSEGTAPAAVDLDELKTRMQRSTVDGAAVYEEFAKRGVPYGPAHRAITVVHHGNQQVLARLSIPSAADESGYSLHPSLLSGALQSALLLMGDAAGDFEALPVPHTLERLRILSPCTGAMFAWARSSSDGFPTETATTLNVDLIDAAGNVCAQLRGLAFQAGDAATASRIEPEWLFSNETSSVAGEGAHVVAMGAEEKVTLILRQEVAIQLQKRVEDIPTDCSHFDLGLSSLAITKLVQDANRLLGEELSPTVLFEYPDIQSLSAYLAARYPAKVDAVMAIRRTVESGETRRRFAQLSSRRRPMSIKVRPVRSSHEPAPIAASAADTNGLHALNDVLWQDAVLADGYEKVTF